MDVLGTWIAAFLTLAIFSFLYKDNPIFRFAEHLLVGISAGYYVYQYCFSALYKKLYVPVFEQGQPLLIIGGILGGLMLFRFSRRTEWVSRFALAFYVGAGAGYTIPNLLNSQVLAQIEGVFPTALSVATPWTIVKDVLVLIGVVSILIYFYFSSEHTGIFKRISQVGITFLMIGFGASFGYTIMGRVTLLIGRFQFLIEEWPQAWP